MNNCGKWRRLTRLSTFRSFLFFVSSLCIKEIHISSTEPFDLDHELPEIRSVRDKEFEDLNKPDADLIDFVHQSYEKDECEQRKAGNGKVYKGLDVFKGFKGHRASVC